MCGFVGFYEKISTSSEINKTYLAKMSQTLAHRGPDDHGYWQHPPAGIHLAHRRLAIVDLSPAGHQPMHSPNQRFVLVFNGEIYNHLKIRHELLQAGYTFSWRGHSDTETLLAGFETWGIEATLKRSIGMFAMAIWDQQASTLTLARDRFGEKPLYYGWQGNVFLFGSELKALRAHPAFKASIHRGALCLYLRHSAVPAPYSIYTDIYKLKPGCLLTLSTHQPASCLPTPQPYWSIVDSVLAGQQQPFSGSATAAVDELEILLRDAIGQQMMGDVPLGAFLSGGVDSSTVVALMQTQSTQPIKTFAIGFREDAYNEATYAQAVARHLGTDHTELYITPTDSLTLIPQLPIWYDEPFADSSQLPTRLVAALARQQVTVSLSGDAGDELFAGYNRYAVTAHSWQQLSHLPKILRKIMAYGIVQWSPTKWNRLIHQLQRWIPAFRHWALLGEKLHKGAGVLASPSLADLYLGLVSQWQDPTAIVIDGEEPETLINTPFPSALAALGAVERMMLLDLLTYLPDDILCKVDRAAMSVSLESRVPFLDHRVVEWAWRLPLEYKLREGQTKWILRQVLYRHVPPALIERPKMGFGVPIDSWLRGPLREWAETLLYPQRLQQEGYFNPAPIRQKWAEHLSGQQNGQHQLWTILAFQQWLEYQTKTSTTAYDSFNI